MGLDAWICARKRTDTPLTGNDIELIYWRKNHDLHHFIGHQEESGSPRGLLLDRKMLENIIDFEVHHPDYWYDWEPLDYEGNPRSPEEMSGYIEEANGFKKIGQLCYLLSMYDDWMKAGYQLFYVASW